MLHGEMRDMLKSGIKTTSRDLGDAKRILADIWNIANHSFESNHVLNIIIKLALRPNPTSFFVLTPKRKQKKSRLHLLHSKKLRLMTEIVLNSLLVVPPMSSNRKQFFTAISTLFFGSPAEAILKQQITLTFGKRFGRYWFYTNNLWL